MWLQQLRLRVGVSKCFNCFALGHRIDSCRDPSRCLHCLRFGHKTRFCPAHAPAVAAAAVAAAPPPASTSTVVVAAPTSSAAAAASVETAAAAGGTAMASVRRAAQNPYDAAFHWIPGAAGQRPDHVTVTVRRTDDIREEERMLEAFTLLAVQMDARVRLPLALVKQEAV